MKSLVANLLLILTSTTLSASPIITPKPRGKFDVGTKSFEMTDKSRTQHHENGPRRFMVQAYFPTEQKSDNSFEYMPETLDSGKVLGVTVHSHANPNAHISKKENFPLIIFQHGWDQTRQSYSILCEELASQGFVILSIDQPYVASFVKFKDGTRICPRLTEQVWGLLKWFDYLEENYRNSRLMAIGDILFLIQHLPAIEIAKNINQNNITLMGHSFGGSAILGVKPHKQIKGKIVLDCIDDCFDLSDESFAGPTLFIRAEKNYGKRSWIPSLEKSYRKMPEKDKVIKSKNGCVFISYPVEHCAFSDMPFLKNHINISPSPALGSSFSDLLSKLWRLLWNSGPAFGSGNTDLGPFTPREWFDTLSLDIRSWLKNKTLLFKDTF